MRIFIALITSFFCFTACGSSGGASSQSYSGYSNERSIYVDTHKGCSASAASRSSGQRFTIIPFPGNAAFKRHFFKNTDKMADLFLGDSFTYPDIQFFDDEGRPNAWAVSAKSQYARPKVLIGPNMIEFLVDPILTGGTGFNTAALSSVLAHEYAHLVQFELDARGSTKELELMADTLSGYHSAFGAIVADRYDLSSDQLRGLSYQLSNSQKRVFELGDYKIYDRNHHGTPRERLRAFNAGVEFAIGQARRSGRIYRDHDDFLDAVEFAADFHDVYIP